MIERIAAAIQELPPSPGSNILLFHHGLEGQIARYQGALRYAELLPLKQAGVDYLALGHIHKSYAVEGWIFNPGATEANSIEESVFDRGAYLVEINQSGIHAELKQDYYQRSIVRLKLTTQGDERVEQVEQSAMTQVQRAIQSGTLDPQQQPIVELRIEGKIGFERLDLDVRQLQQQLQELSNALIFLFRYNVDTKTFVSPLSEEAQRSQIEQDIFIDLLTANNTYKKRATELSQGLIELKNQQLQGRSETDLYRFVQDLLGDLPKRDYP
jgi:DNA repair exonuclease SbcCD nuclease subunit